MLEITLASRTCLYEHMFVVIMIIMDFRYHIRVSVMVHTISESHHTEFPFESFHSLGAVQFPEQTHAVIKRTVSRVT